MVILSKHRLFRTLCVVAALSSLSSARATIVMDQIGPSPFVVGAAAIGRASQEFEAGFVAYNIAAIDDFATTSPIQLNSLEAVTIGFNGTSGNYYNSVQSWRVEIYSSPAVASGNLTGDVASRQGLVAPAVTITTGYIAGNPDTALIHVDLTGGAPITLNACNTYWIALMARLDFAVGGEIGVYDGAFATGFPNNLNSAQANPGNGFGMGTLIAGNTNTAYRIDAVVAGTSGACCIPTPGGCITTTEACCETTGGSYNGDNSTCAAANCPPPGACCATDGTCSLSTQAACQSPNSWGGANSTCTPGGCVGRCCVGSNCSVVSAFQCGQNQGTYGGGGTTCGGGYTITQSTGTITPGTTDVGNHIDDGQTLITLPFPFTFYGVTYTSANVCSNGNVQFGTLAGTFTAAYTNDCLPSPAQITGPMIAPFWDDQRTEATYPGTGIFTAVLGSSPNQQFVIEWRTVIYDCSTLPNTVAANYEMILNENSSAFDVIYGSDIGSACAGHLNGASATVGIQSGTGAAVQFECNTGGLATGMKLHVAPVQVCNQIARGDMNCDGLRNGKDIAAWALAAVGGQAAYSAVYPNCNYLNGDFTNDALVSSADVSGLVTCILTGTCP